MEKTRKQESLMWQRKIWMFRKRKIIYGTRKYRHASLMQMCEYIIRSRNETKLEIIKKNAVYQMDLTVQR